jgi:RecB family exonuclease
MRYSYSRVRKFRECPRAFRFEYIDRIEVPEFETIEAFMGGKVHQALEALYKSAIRGDTPSLEDVLATYEGLWYQDAHPGLVVNAAGKSVEDFRFTGAKCLLDYYHSYKPFSQARIIGTEMEVKVDLLGDGRYVFLGFIDRLDMHSEGKYEIHDYKTGMRISEGEDWQLALYEMGIRRKMPDVREVDHVWHYLRHNKEIRCRRTYAEQERLKKEILSTLAEIEKAVSEDFFPAEKTRLCAWCPYNGMCAGEKKETRQSKLGRFFI